MKKGFGLINEEYSRISRDQLRNNPGECFHTIACAFDRLRRSLKGNRLGVYAPFLTAVSWRPL
jgi:hypothetical protein